MMRLPITTLVLGRADIKDFEKRRRRQATTNARIHIAGRPGGQYAIVDLSQDLLVRVRDQSKYGSVSQLAEEEAHGPPSLRLQGIVQDQVDRTATVCHQEVDRGLSEVDLSEEEHDFPYSGLKGSPENLMFNTRRNSSLSKDDFHFSGFVTSSVHDDTVLPSRSPPRNAHATTPSMILHTEHRRLRGLLTLPRSPLFILQNLPISPECNATAGLTPRVASRVANHNHPGIIFSQPARRPPRRHTHNFRHQTNSFSFDSSERASAAYEQERIASYSTAESNDMRLSAALNLHDELHGSLLPDSGGGSEFPSSSEASNPSIAGSLSCNTQANQFSITRGDFVFSSPQLSLPPPFSSASRNSSNREVLPSATVELPLHPLTSPIRQPSPSSARKGDQDISRAQSDSVLQKSPSSAETSPNGKSHLSLLQRATQVFSSYRSRTPSNQSSPSHPSLSPSPSPPRNNTSHHLRVQEIRIPSNYRVYDDLLPPHTQPQTPAHLPEARHSSRFHPSLTAPMVRALSVINPGPRRTDHVRAGARQLSAATPSRRGAGRSESPIGLISRGFEGLYGGRENGDEEQSWADGVRFGNAGIRLWGLRDARNDGRSMRETPEPEEWRISGRN